MLGETLQLYVKVFGLITTRWPYSVFIKITLTLCRKLETAMMLLGFSFFYTIWPVIVILTPLKQQLNMALEDCFHLLL